MLANDPHLATSVPGIWYQTGLHCRAVTSACPFDVSGFTFSGMPGVVIGHNDSIAWGFTNLAPDVSDFYLEKVTDGTYLRDGQQAPLEVSTETIKVAGGNDVKLTVRRTVHGPIVSDVLDSVGRVGRNALVRLVPQQDTYAVSLAWTGLVPNTTADSIFALNTAKDFTQFRAAAAKFAVPAQNLVYADTAGHIGYQAPGMVPIRSTSVPNTPPGYWPAPGWDSQYDWKGFVPFEQLPWTYDPPEGMVVTANNQVTAATGPTVPYLTTDWDYGWRSSRIEALLKQTDKVSPERMSQIQNDTYNSFAPTLVQALLQIDLSGDEFTQQAQQLLGDWDFTQPAEKGKAAVRASYYNAVWMRVVQYTFNDELPQDLQADGGGRYMAAMLTLLKDPTNGWWDDRRTPGLVESRDEILRKALVQARLDLAKHLGKDPVTWTWGELHTLTVKNQVLGGDGVPQLVQRLFNRGPIPLGGGPSIVNANGWNAASGTFEVTRGPSMRMVVDLGTLDASHLGQPDGGERSPLLRALHRPARRLGRLRDVPVAGQPDRRGRGDVGDAPAHPPRRRLTHPRPEVTTASTGTSCTSTGTVPAGSSSSSCSSATTSAPAARRGSARSYEPPPCPRRWPETVDREGRDHDDGRARHASRCRAPGRPGRPPRASRGRGRGA